MATISPNWTENQNLRTAANLGISGTDTKDIDAANLGADALMITTDIALGSSTAGVTVEFFRSANSGTDDDDVAFMSYTATADERRTVAIYGEPYVAVKITNDDGSNVTGDISQIYAWRNWTSA